jgi:hypothetical protein
VAVGDERAGDGADRVDVEIAGLAVETGGGRAEKVFGSHDALR